MNRYPDQQQARDDEDRRQYRRAARLRPGASVVVAVLDMAPESGRVLSSRVSELDPEHGDAVLVATRGHGRRWFHTHGHPFRVVQEISP